MKVGTSIVLGNKATPTLAAEAVANAMEKAEISIANSLLLFLTSEFADYPQPAIRAAAKAANCTQVFGCSATGIFTEDDWVLDSPAAAVMVFGGNLSIETTNLNLARQALLTLCAPNAINNTWLNDGYARYGGISGNAVGQGPFSVWQNAKGGNTGMVNAYFAGVNLSSKASHGIKILTKPKIIHKSNGFDIEILDHKTPLNPLLKALATVHKINTKTDDDIVLPCHLIMAIYADSLELLNKGEYQQTNVISYDDKSGSITLAQPLKHGVYLSWGLRDQAESEMDLKKTIIQLRDELGAIPDFGLLFSCLGRGPFYDGIDHDLKIISHELPKMPLIGFYGNGEIATIGAKNQLLPYSAVLSIFSAAIT